MTAKRMALLLAACVPSLAVLLSGCSAARPGGKLAWEENFNANRLDDRVWSKITRAKTPAFKYMSADERCYDLRDGLLVLRGIVNDDREADTAAYLTEESARGTSIVSSRDGSRCARGCMGARWGLAGDLDRGFRPHAVAPREGRSTLWSLSTTIRSFIRRLIPTIRWTWASGKRRPSMRLPDRPRRFQRLRSGYLARFARFPCERRSELRLSEDRDGARRAVPVLPGSVSDD